MVGVITIIYHKVIVDCGVIVKEFGIFEEIEACDQQFKIKTSKLETIQTCKFNQHDPTILTRER